MILAVRCDKLIVGAVFTVTSAVSYSQKKKKKKKKKKKSYSQ